MAHVTILDDLVWDADISRWVLHCEITIGNTSPTDPDVPQTSAWYVHIPREYPFGEVRVHPSVKNSLVFTHYHQQYNHFFPGKSWGEGLLCLSYVGERLGSGSRTALPRDSDEHLVAVLTRATEWIERAATNVLVAEGDPFELPPVVTSDMNFQRLVFQEDAVTFKTWTESVLTYGAAVATTNGSSAKYFYIKAFGSMGREVVLKAHFGLEIEETAKTNVTVHWMRLSGVPVVSHWHLPFLWKDLFQVLEREPQGIDPIRKMNARHSGFVLMLGFPIPERFSKANAQLHWFAVEVPRLKSKKESWEDYKKRLIDKGIAVKWIPTENWTKSRLAARGALPTHLTEKNILVIGAGAIGSSFSEAIMRGGASKIRVLDPEILEVGNLARHTLGSESLRQPKATRLASRLNSLSPFAQATSRIANVTSDDAAFIKDLNEADIVVDCTGSDDVLRKLGAVTLPPGKILMSFSMGYGGKRGFFACTRGECFPIELFAEKMDPFLQQDRAEYDVDDLPWEFLGCWNPVFPTRMDVISVQCSVALQRLVGFLESADRINEFLVFHHDDGQGIRVEVCDEK